MSIPKEDLPSTLGRRVRPYQKEIDLIAKTLDLNLEESQMNRLNTVLKNIYGAAYKDGIDSQHEMGR